MERRGGSWGLEECSDIVPVYMQEGQQARLHELQGNQPNEYCW